MSSEQCALDANGNLKDAKHILFYNDPDDSEPIHNPPSNNTVPPTLRRGHRSKNTTRLKESIAQEQLDSDADGLEEFTSAPKRTRVRNNKTSRSTTTATAVPLSSGNVFDPLSVEDLIDDGDFSDSSLPGLETDSDSDDDDDDDISEVITNAEVFILPKILIL